MLKRTTMRKNMEEDVMDMGNAIALVPMPITPSTPTPIFVFGETSEIQPDDSTASHTTSTWANNLPPFLKQPKISGGFPEYVPLASWPSYERETGPFQPITPNFTILRDSAAQGSANAEASSGNVTPTGQASFPPGAQKTISEICE